MDTKETIDKNGSSSGIMKLKGHLYMIQNMIGIESKKGNKRKEQVIINRLRIGHCKLNKTLHVMGKHPTGLCDECQEEETIKHILYL